MELTQDQLRKLKTTGFLIFIGGFLGPFYVIFSDGFSSAFPFINASTAGILIAINIAFFELFLFSERIKKLPFYQIITIRVLLYATSILMIILCVLIFSRMIKFDLNFYEVIQSKEFTEYILCRDFIVVVFYAFSIVALTNFTIQMNRKMGQGVLVNIITGRYYWPKKSNKIVMFLKILDTKQLIAEVGRLNYHKFLKEVIYDITEVILFRQGVIYEYVEDELVLVWEPGKGFKNANCIRVFFEMQEKLEMKKVSYYEKYHFLPEMVASLHYGEVITAEIGDIKSEIKYLGDLMNTCSRILGKTNKKQRFLGSSAVIQEINMPVIYDSEAMGEIALKGKTIPVKLFRLFEKELAEQ